MEDKDGKLTQYSYNKKNQLLHTTEDADGETSTSDYVYDANGNQLIKMTTVLKDADDLDEETLLSLNTPYAEINTYDPYNRLTESIAASETVTYSYRPDGLRNSKSSNGVTTTHLWDGANIVGDLQNGVIGATYVRGIGLISSNGMYYLQNGHGDTVQLTNASGAITKTYDYDTFGVERDIDAQDANPFRYCGEYFDTETETIYLRARYYNPRTGRFTAEDPIGDGLNWYTYCVGNPIRYIDPTGLEMYLSGSEEQVWEIYEGLNMLTHDAIDLKYIRQEDGSYAYKVVFVEMNYKKDYHGIDFSAGTELVATIINNPNYIVTIYPVQKFGNNLSEPKTNGAAVFFDPFNDPYNSPIWKNGTVVDYGPKPTFLSLGHELIHVLGYIEGTTVRDGPLDFNSEELATIGLLGNRNRRITEMQLWKEHGFSQ